MKKLLFLIIILLLTFTRSFGVEVEIDGLWYSIVHKTNKVSVIKYKDINYYSGNIIIPETIEYNGEIYSVTCIGESAFKHCPDLSSITIPKSINSIEKNAFEDCRDLVYVNISDIEAWCKIIFDNNNSNPLSCASHLFLNGEEVYDLVVPNTVQAIGNYTFQNCSNLTSVTIPSSVTSIGDYAFDGCDRLTSVFISNIEAWCNINFSYKSNPLIYAHHLFLNGDEVKDLVIPSSVTDINDYAFSECSSLSSVTIPNSVINIGTHAFSNCNGLVSVTIPNSVTSIGRFSFSNCKGLTSVTISSSVLYIEAYSFSGCSGLISVTIPNSVQTIDACAFQDCTGLTSVIIPNSVWTIDNSAFRNCQKIKNVTIPNSVTKIGYNAFDGCSELSLIVIGSGIREICGEAFANCPDLNDVYCYAESVPKWSVVNSKPILNFFDNSYIEYATLHVPSSSISMYNNYAPWKGFMNIVSLPYITYIIDGEIYKQELIMIGASINALEEPSKEGYTFSGWSEIPETMPAEDVTVTGTFSINSYTLTYVIDDEVYKQVVYEYGATIMPEPQPEGDYVSFEWAGLPETMPAHDVTVTAVYETGIAEIMMMAQQGRVSIYSPNGKRLKKPQKGLNIVVMPNGTTRKVAVR